MRKFCKVLMILVIIISYAVPYSIFHFVLMPQKRIEKANAEQAEDLRYLNSLKMDVLSKTNKDGGYYGGSYYDYSCSFELKLSNESPDAVTSFFGDLIIKDVDNIKLVETNIQSYDKVNSNSSKTWIINIYLNNDANTQKLLSADLNDLNIYFNYTAIHFSVRSSLYYNDKNNNTESEVLIKKAQSTNQGNKQNDENEEDFLEPNTYRCLVTFVDDCYGSTIRASVWNGSTVEQPFTPTIDGYEFRGWYKDPYYTERFWFSTPINEDTTLYAKWEPTYGYNTATYTVTFNSMGGIPVSMTHSVNEGESVEIPARPTKDGYDFDGWYTNTSYTQEFDFDTMIYSDKTLYAKWVPVTNTTYYTVTFNTQGGSNIEAKDVASGNTVTEPEAPTKDGCAFMGWYTNQACTEPFGFDSAIHANTTLYAKWVEIVVNGFEFELNDEGSAYEIIGYNGEETEIVLPQTYNNKPVMAIANAAFYNNTSLTSVDIPNGITKIGANAFRDCSRLISITIPSSITNVGNNAFCDFANNYNVIPTMNYLGTLEQWVQITFGNIFSNPTYRTQKLIINGQEITEAVINNSTKIGNYAFINCQDLTSVIIGNSVTAIGTSAFQGCTGITSLTIPNNVTSIGDYAFSRCSGLMSVSIGNSVTAISVAAFQFCSSLTSIIIPDNVTMVETWAFEGCSKLTSVSIGTGVTNIGGAAFSNCGKLRSIFIPVNVTTMDANVFYNCYALSKIYCEAESQPYNWYSTWNDNCDADVIWGYQG